MGRVLLPYRWAAGCLLCPLSAGRHDLLNVTVVSLLPGLGVQVGEPCLGVVPMPLAPKALCLPVPYGLGGSCCAPCRCSGDS